MRILLLAAASSVHVVRWANAFVQRGHEVHLVSQHPAANGLSDEIVVHPLPHFGGAGYLLNGGKIRQLVAEIHPDVVNVHYASGYGTLSRAVHGPPLVLNVWGSDVFEFPDKSWFHRIWLIENLRKADQLVSTSGSMARRTTALAPRLPAVKVVPFGVDTVIFHPPEGPKRKGPLVIGTVKTLASKYGIDTLIQAFALLVQRLRGTDLRLRIVGGGPQERELKRLARRHGIMELVEFTGPVPHSQVPDRLREMDVFAALSRADSESFGVAVIEASSCGLPVLVSDAGGLPEVVKDGVTGYVVPRNDPNAAMERLFELVTSNETRSRLGEAGRVHVQRQYSWPVCVDSMMDVFRSVLQGTDQ